MKPKRFFSLFTAQVSILALCAGFSQLSLVQAGPYYYNEMGGGGGYNAGSPNGHGYAGLSAGFVFPNEAKVKVNDGKLNDSVVDLDGETGGFGGLKFGWQFPDSGLLKYAIEAELLYSSNEFTGTGTSGGSDVQYDGDMKTLAMMINGLLRFDLGAFEPYAGLGVGAVKGWVKDPYFLIDNELQDGNSDISDWGWGWQFMLGGELMLFSDRVGLFTEYKYLSLMSIEQLEEFRQHMLGLGLRVHF